MLLAVAKAAQTVSLTVALAATDSTLSSGYDSSKQLLALHFAGATAAQAVAMPVHSSYLDSR